MKSSFRSACLRRVRRGAVVLSAGCVVGLLAGCGSGLGSASSVSSPLSHAAAAAGPQLGYVWSESDATLRPILGVPGAAQIGTAVTAAGAYTTAAVDPVSGFALLIAHDGGLYRMTLPSGNPTLLDKSVTPGTLVRLSPKGSAAVVFTPGAASAVVWTQLAAAAQSRQVPSSAAIRDAAVSDGGTVALASQSSSGLALIVTAASSTIGLPSVASLGGLTFISGSEDLLVADSGSNTLTRFHLAASNADATPVPVANLLNAPTSLGISRDGRWAVTVNASDSSVVRVDLSGKTAPQRSVCSCKPTVVAALAGDAMFRLTPLKSGPVWVGNAAASSFPLLFVPAISSGSTEGQQ